MTDAPDASAPPAPPPRLAQSAAVPAFGIFCLYWLRLGLTSFGGPAGQIAMMQSELVDRRRWIDQRRFLHALNFCMLLPGPEAQQLATYIGWRLHGVRGGLVAGGLFVLPGALVLLVLSWIAAAHGDTGLVGALFDGIKPAVVAIIVAAVWRMGRRTLKGPAAVAMAGAAFLALFALHLPFPLVIGAAAAVGGVAARTGRHWFAHPHPVADGDSAKDEPDEPAPKPARLLGLAMLFVLLWAVPVGAVLLAFGTDPWRGIAALFTKAAFVTFGGAYAVLPYIAGQAVESYGWLSPREMVDGLALAETTPGPLILVTQYVGFFAGWNRPGDLSPGLAGALGAALTTYVTFLPCFLFIFAGAPYVERLIHNRLAAGALAAIAAAVVGVILNLGVYLGMAVLLPHGQSAGHMIWAWAIMLAALYALTRRGVAIHWVVLGGAAAGLLQAAASSL